jgi:hypothetical protein
MVYNNNGPIYSVLSGGKPMWEWVNCQAGKAFCQEAPQGPFISKGDCESFNQQYCLDFKCGTMNFTCWYDEGPGTTVWEMRGGTGCVNDYRLCPLGGQYEVGSLPPTPCTEGDTFSLDVYCPGV